MLDLSSCSIPDISWLAPSIWSVLWLHCQCGIVSLDRASILDLLRFMAAAQHPSAAPATAALAEAPTSPVEAFLVPSRRGKNKLNLNGYSFQHRNTLKSGEEVWRCDSPGCAEKCVSRRVGERIFVDTPPTHLHLANPDKILRAEAMSKAKVEATTQPRSTVTECVSDVLAARSDVPLEIMPTKYQMKRAMWNARFSEQKKRLKADGDADADYSSLTALVLPDALKKMDSEPFLLHDSGPETRNKRVLIFATKLTLDFLETCDIWLMDGTFKAAPQLFQQIYTIHGFKDFLTTPHTCCIH